MGLFFSAAKPIDYDFDYDKINIVADIIKEGANRSDGFIVLFIDDEEEAKYFRHAFTMRPLKGLVVPVWRYRFIELVGNQKIETIFGSVTNFENTKLLAFESTFKFSSMRETEEKLIKELKEVGLFIAVNMNKHNTKWLTYQPLNTLPLSDEAVKKMADANIEAINGLGKFDNFVKLAPAATRRAIMTYRALAKDSYIEKESQVGYRKFRTTAKGGALCNAGSFKAICPDLPDLYGGKSLQAGECCCNALPEGRIIIVRYPHTSIESWVVLYNRHIDMGIVDPHVLVLNNYDDAAQRLGGADFDGDKVLVIENELYKELIMECLNSIDIPHIKAPEGKAVKADFNAKTANLLKKKFFAALNKRNQIGCYSNNLAKAFALLYEASTEAEVAKANELIVFWTQKVLVEVDKEKHGGFYLEAPEDAFELGALPNFIKFAKLAKHIGSNSTFKLDKDTYAERMACPLEKYSIAVDQNTKPMSEFKVELEDEFDWTNLLANPEVVTKIPSELFSRNEVKRENGKVVKVDGKAVYKNGGYFDKIVYACRETLVDWAEKMGTLTEGTTDEIRLDLLCAIFEHFAKKLSYTKGQMYDAAVGYIFGYVKDNNEYKRLFWELYQKEAEEVLEAKFGTPELREEELDEINESYADEEMPW